MQQINKQNVPLYVGHRKKLKDKFPSNFYPKEVIKRSLFHQAGTIILVCNHPSENAKLSNADIDLITQITNARDEILNITIHGHIIISNNEYYSFKSNMLL